jgi:hypothetical protein
MRRRCHVDSGYRLATDFQPAAFGYPTADPVG